MLRVVLPAAVAAGSAIRDVLPVGVSYEVVIGVYVDIVVAAAPPAVITPAASPCGTHGNPDAK